ncbi:MAG: endopeptidase La [Chloroflexota bacterium]|nr:endopeptidase La [Chloroflexota bacterium]
MTDLNAVSEFFDIGSAATDDDGVIECPVIPLREQVVFPNVVSPIALHSKRAIAAAEAAYDQRRTAIVIWQDEASDLEIEGRVLVGTEIALGRVMRMPDDSRGALMQGRRRVQILRITQKTPYVIAQARIVIEKNTVSARTSALMQVITNLFRRVVELNENIPEDVLLYVLNAQQASVLSDLVASTLTLAVEERQALLEEIDVEQRLNQIVDLLNQELTMLELKDEITSQVNNEMDRSQREMYLREQMRVIQGELGEEDIFQQELNEVRDQIAAAEMPPDIHEKAMKEFARLSIMAPLAPEVGMVRTYIDWMTALPWSRTSPDQLDVQVAQQTLDREHFGLPKIKDRILEYIAVRKLAPDRATSPILCFVGPPGVGKTSLGKSIAAALGREFVRVSLGGVRDEAEIRGHRRTYIGALPGRILQTMRRAGTINPVFMLDEIDKLGADFRGDPAAALLEILDPEQNHAFSDHYLDLPYDLSKILFITTANDLDPIPPALLDRLEVIEFSGYTEEEKSAIARQFLIPKQIEANGLSAHPVTFEAAALFKLIREYTYEAGVRNLSRELANVSRKVARLIAEEKRYPRAITAAHVERFLGPPPFLDTRANDQDAIGIATGMAWTPYGGEILTIEVSALPGKGTLMLTGSLGDVMQESAQTALSYMRARWEELKLPYDDLDYFDIHVHLPEGAVPKDGPSAGITLAIAIISAFTERPVRSDTAMTGEITLRGKILPVGGIKEKLLAARRARIKHILIPKQNEHDLRDIPREARQDFEIHLVETMGQVIEWMLLEAPSGERRLDRLRRERDKDGQREDDE